MAKTMAATFRPLSPLISFSSPLKPVVGFSSLSLSLPPLSLSLSLSLRLQCISAPNPYSSSYSSCDSHGEEIVEEKDFWVVNFYKFVLIEDPELEVSKQLDFLQGRNIHGRIYINKQGINAQYSGPSKDAMDYVEFLKKDPRFSDILIQTSPALNGHAFPRLKLRYKPSLVQMEGGISHLPVLEPEMRAKPLNPSEWKKILQEKINVNSSSNMSDKKFLLLDVRNGYEWDIGHFEGAERPNVDCFRSTSFGLSKDEIDPLNGVDKENTNILMYCTGGIRCDVYSTILRKKGFKNLYTLSGGVSNYLKNEGSVEWVGNLFVFDSRLALPPAKYNPKENFEKENIEMENKINALGKCYICGSHLQEFKHRNCANLDCNRLFLCCFTCVKDLRGCCCADCKNAPRIRPVLPGFKRYDRWHVYRDTDITKDATKS